MKGLLKRLHKLSEGDLVSLSEAIDVELEHRLNQADEVPESARRRAVQRSQSYRHSTGAAAIPIMAVGLREEHQRRKAA